MYLELDHLAHLCLVLTDQLWYAVPSDLIGHRVADYSVELPVPVRELIEVLALEEQLGRAILLLGAGKVLERERLH